jgi:hypothetical protein
MFAFIIVRNQFGRLTSPLFKMMQRRGYNNTTKIIYDPKKYSCSFCKQIGHSYSACLLRETEPIDAERHPFVETLMRTPQISSTIFHHLTLEEAKDKFMTLGNAFNESNPWKNSTSHRQKLLSRLGFWKAIGADKRLLTWIAYGLPLRFQIEPEAVEHPNPKSFNKYSEWAHSEIDKQIALDRYRVVNPDFPFVVHPTDVLARTKPDGSLKMRRVDATLWINAHTASHQFKMETNKCLPSILSRGDYTFIIDLTDCYYQFSMETRARPYCCYSDGKRLICSLVLLMGMKPASLWVGKACAPILRFFRALKIACTNFIDDWCGGDRPDRAHLTRQFMIHVLVSLGFSINMVKSATPPSPSTLYLGAIHHTDILMWTIPISKIDKAITMIDTIVFNDSNLLPTLVSLFRTLIGTLSSFCLALPNIHLWLHHAHKQNSPDLFPDDLIFVNRSAIADFKELPSILRTRNGAHFSTRSPNFNLMVDAGEVGIGEKFAIPGQLPTVDGEPLPIEEIGTSSTRRELIAAITYIKKHANLMTIGTSATQPTTLRLVMDSQASVKAIIKGSSPKPLVNDALKTISNLCYDFNLRIAPDWTPREDNGTSDWYSKIWADNRKLLINEFMRRLITATFGSQFRLIFPEFGKLPFFFRRRSTNITPNIPVILVHPVWPKQPWWPTLLSLRSHHIELGVYSQLITTLDPAQSRSPIPNWKFSASLLLC